MASGVCSTGSAGSQAHGSDINMQNLLEELLPICHRWDFIGSAMGVERSTIERIRLVHAKQPEDALFEVISEWLNAESSWEGLVKVLRSRILKENRLAGIIQKKYLQNDTQFQPQMQLDLSLRAQQVMTRATKHSLGIEVQPIGAEALYLVRGDIIHSGRIAEDVYKSYAAYLKDCYCRSDESKLPLTCTICSYINLAVVITNPNMNREKADDFTKDTLHHGIDEILGKKEPLEIEDILKPLKGHSNVKCVLVEGPPGVGKSRFAWELCQRWDNIPDLKKFSLVVLLRFRDKWVQEAKEIADLFFHDDASIQQAVAKEVCIRRGKGLLLILDGFDEFPASLRECSLLLDIMKGLRRLPRCTVVVTSRPSATRDLFEKCRVDKHVEVLGFTQKQIEEYSHKVFASEPQLLDDFHKFRKFNPAITSMMYIPINTAIVTNVFLCTGKPLSHTITQLYVEMSLVILRTYLKSIRHKLANFRAKTLEDLPSEILSHLVKIGAVAFKGVVNQEVIFNELPTDCDHFGFMNASPELHIRADPATSYNFLHRSFQELFTAFYISQLKPSDQKEIFDKYFQKSEGVYHRIRDDQFKEVWKFLAGLTNFRNIGWEVVKSNSSIQQLVSYLYEAQDVAACDSVLGETPDDGFIFNPSCLFDCYAVGWCIAASECRLGLSFSSMESGAEAFVTGVNSRDEPRGVVSGLHLFNTPLKEEGMSHLIELPLCIWQKMTRLDISQCQLNAAAINKLADLVVHMVCLKRLSVRSNNIGESGFVKLFNSLSKLECIEKLLIGDNSIGCADVKALSHLIRQDAGHLKKLTIKGERFMLPECQQLLLETLVSPSSLEHLGIYDVKVPFAADIFALLENNHNLKSIVAMTIGRALPSLLNAMENNNSVEALQIDCKHAELPALVKMLSTNCCLQTLEIRVAKDSNEQRRRKTCLDIINALQDNHTLKKLDLYCSDLYCFVRKSFTPAEIDEMDSRVKLHDYNMHKLAIN